MKQQPLGGEIHLFENRLKFTVAALHAVLLAGNTIMCGNETDIFKLGAEQCMNDGKLVVRLILRISIGDNPNDFLFGDLKSIGCITHGNSLSAFDRTLSQTGNKILLEVSEQQQQRNGD